MRYNTCIGSLMQINGCQVYTSGSPACGNAACARLYEAKKRQAHRHGRSISDALTEWYAYDGIHGVLIAQKGQDYIGFSVTESLEEFLTGATSGIEASETDENELRRMRGLTGEMLDETPALRTVTEADAETVIGPRWLRPYERSAEADSSLVGRSSEYESPQPRWRVPAGESVYVMPASVQIAKAMGWLRPWLAGAAAGVTVRVEPLEVSGKIWMRANCRYRGCNGPTVDGEHYCRQPKGIVEPSDARDRTRLRNMAARHRGLAVTLAAITVPTVIDSTEWGRMDQIGESKYGYPTGPWSGPVAA